jgi:formamidopyrimidine-DNA glycosylase
MPTAVLGYTGTVPELVDVEGFRRVLADHAVRRIVRDVDVVDAQVIRDINERRFADAVRGRSFSRPARHGKWLIAPLSGNDERAVLMHFGMTGSLEWARSGQGRHGHDRVVFVFGHGELRVPPSYARRNTVGNARYVNSRRPPRGRAPCRPPASRPEARTDLARSRTADRR